MFSRRDFDKALEAVAVCYRVSAPTVGDWCDMLYAAKDDQVTLADIHLLSQINQNIRTMAEVPANTAANQVYHLMNRLGRDTTGHAGF